MLLTNTNAETEQTIFKWYFKKFLKTNGIGGDGDEKKEFVKKSPSDSEAVAADAATAEWKISDEKFI